MVDLPGGADGREDWCPAGPAQNVDLVVLAMAVFGMEHLENQLGFAENCGQTWQGFWWILMDFDGFRSFKGLFGEIQDTFPPCFEISNNIEQHIECRTFRTLWPRNVFESSDLFRRSWPTP